MYNIFNVKRKYHAIIGLIIIYIFSINMCMNVCTMSISLLGYVCIKLAGVGCLRGSL